VPDAFPVGDLYASQESEETAPQETVPTSTGR
jgi:hypothetical protein